MKHKDILHPEVKLMAGHCGELRRLCRAWGGREMEQGDVSFVLPLYDFFPVWLQFWDADEEFPAQLGLLWDANTLDFMYYETTWYALGFLCQEILRRLGEAEE